MRLMIGLISLIISIIGNPINCDPYVVGWYRFDHSHVVLQPQVLDVLSEALEGVVPDGRDLVLVEVQRPKLMDRPQRRRWKLLDQVRRHRQRRQ